MSDKKRAYCLYRVSTDKQVDHNESNEADIPMQRKACHRFAEKMGWEIIHEEQEEGVSGHKVRAEKRDKLQIIKEDAKKGKFDVLLVFMFDRIGRIADETPFVVEWFVKNGIEVWSTQEGEQRFDNHTDKLLNYIRFWQADGESEKTSIRTRTSLGQLVEDGHYKGGSAAYGYSLVKNGRVNKRKHELCDLAPNETEAPVVRLIFDKYTLEGYGVQQIANYLNDHGIMNRSGNRWSNNTIRNMLHNETYTGILRSGKSRSERIEALQIIPQSQFDRAQEICRQRAETLKNMPRVPLNMKGNCLLSGNVFCGHCGSRLNLSTANRCYTKADGSTTKKRRIRYVCYGKTRKLTVCGGQSGYTADKLDDMIDTIIKEIFQRLKGVSKKEILSCRCQSELRLRKEQLKKLRLEYAKAADTASKLREEVVRAIQGESAFPKEMLAQLVTEAEEKANSLRAACDSAEQALSSEEALARDLGKRYDEILSWSSLYDSASIEAKKMIVNSLIKRVDVFRDYHLKIEFDFDLQQFFLGLDAKAADRQTATDT